jgi:hypothetical protein
MKNKLLSGQPYTISDLFVGDRKVIIPDLQRDYCWGDPKHGENSNSELVTPFLDGLLDSFKDKRDSDLQLGMIYAYENPENQIQLCDGQQRITTLYLLLGLLYRKTKKEEIKQRLISKFELEFDDKEPYLQYAIRESTLYFLSDLVCSFFIEGTYSFDLIKNQQWYFSEYDLDPSIQSMLKALTVIERLLSGEDINFNEFSEFILKKINFFYFDMVNRQHGEEMFVVINTTGTPLTVTENLKPILIGNITDIAERGDASSLWEKWETWFWRNRLETEHEADNGLNQFFIWYWQIKLKQENDWKGGKQNKLNPIKLFRESPVKNYIKESYEYSAISEEDWSIAISIKEIDKYFEQYCLLIDYFKERSFEALFKSVNKGVASLRNFSNEQALQIILPMLEAMVKFPDQKEMHLQFLRRLRKNYYDGIWSERKDKHIDWRYVLQLIQKSNSFNDCLKFELEFIQVGNVIRPQSKWYTIEEKLKMQLKIQNATSIEKWEDHQDFMGDLSYLFEVDKKNQENSGSYFPDFHNLKRCYDNYISTIDLIRKDCQWLDDEKKKMANLIRLFFVYSKCNQVGHISRVSWEIEGISFSKINNREHLKKDEFKELCAANDTIKYIHEFIKNKIQELDVFNLTKDNFNTDKAVKCWLTLKVYNAIKNNVCLSFYEGNDTGLSININADKNILVDSEPFSLQNMICGFAVKAGRGGESYIHYTSSDLWGKSDIIDSPFTGISFNKEDRNKEQLDQNKKAIDDIVKFIDDSYFINVSKEN